MNEAEVRSYAGIYQNAPDYLRLELLVKDGKLFLKQTGQSEMSQVVNGELCILRNRGHLYFAQSGDIST